MTFIDAIKTVFSKYSDFNGRAARPEFWWYVLFVFLASLVLGAVSDVLYLLFFVGNFVPSLAVTARRLHDIGRSGWWQLIGMVPFIGWIVMIYWCVQPGKDPNPFV